MDLFVAESQERGNQTPTLSGEAIKKKAKTSSEGKVSCGINMKQDVSWHRGSDATILPPRQQLSLRNRNTTSASLWAVDERTVVHENLGLDATPT